LTAFFSPPAIPERPAARLTRRLAAWGVLAMLGVFDFWVLNLMERHLYFTLAAE
jgi:hypothetical protein